MPAPSSSLLLILTFAASLPARLGAAWLAFTSYDAGAGPAPDAAPPEPMTSCHSSGTTDEGAALVEEAAAEPEAKTGEEVMAEAKERLALVLGFQKHEAAILEANLTESADWITMIDTPPWRSAPWQLKLATVFAAAARGAVLTSACLDRSIPRDYETVKRALDLLAHEMNHPLGACRHGKNADATEFIN